MSNFRSDNYLTVTTGRDGHRSFNEHDDRTSSRPHKYGGGGKSRNGYGRNNSGRGGYRDRGRGGERDYLSSNHSRGRGGGGIRKRGGKTVHFNPRSRLDDDGDDDMGERHHDDGSSRRYNPYGSRPQSRRGGRHYSSSRGNSSRYGGHSHETWWKITLPHCRNYEKSYLLKLIQSLITCGSFSPVEFSYDRKNAVFYLEDEKVASAVKEASGKATLPNGFKFIIVKTAAPKPSSALSNEVKTKLKEAMSKRYDPSTKTLDLENLHKDPTMTAENMYMALNKRSVMLETINIIKENIPELVSLKLKSNKITTLGYLQELVAVTPNLKHLDLSNNQLKTVDELDKIKKWDLESLKLDVNVLCDTFTDKTTYISAVRKRFSNLMNLDGNALPPPIKFDVSTTAIIPPSKGSYFPDANLQNLIVKFLKEFYSLYDSDNRPALKDAYHDQATFSLAASYNAEVQYNQSKLNDYFPNSRNLIKMVGWKHQESNIKLLRQGKVPIISHLCLLPKTLHDLNSFVVDVGVVTPLMMSFSVTGVFKESDNKTDKPPIRAFSRHFVAVPCGSGISLTNDTLTITNALPEQVQVAFKNTGPTPSSSPVSSNPPSLPTAMSLTAPPTATTTTTSIPGLTPEQQLQVQQFSSVSKMNMEWSAKCLHENGWNYEKAGQIFLDLNKAGKIPPEAFVK